MHCPKCGLQSENDLRYCRSCGFNLEGVSRLLAGEADANEADREAERAAVRRVQWGLAAAVLCVFIGATVGIIGKKIVHEEIVAAVGALVAMFGMLFGALPLVTSGMFTRSLSGDSRRGRELPPRETTQLPSPPISSVTESTTRQLDTQRPSGEVHA